MKQPVKTFGSNTEGRDFVIGDLHGAYPLFEGLLNHLNFDKSKDRMFSVGDLCDRGPESLKCLELLHEPWFHAVLANHEQMLLHAFEGGPLGRYWAYNGGAWGIEALNTWKSRRIPTDDEHRVFDLLEPISELPYLITVNLTNGKKVHILHAELPPKQGITDEVLADPAKVWELATTQSEDGDFLVWGRAIYYYFYRADLTDIEKVKRSVAYRTGRRHPFNENLSQIISGHTIVQRPLTIMGQTNLDTCACGATSPDARKWEALTCLELNTWKFYQARPEGVTEVEPVVVTREEVEELEEKVKPSKPV